MLAFAMARTANSLIGGHSKVFVCKHFIQTKLAYEMRAKEEHPESWQEYLQTHKFKDGHGACQFMASFTKKRKSKSKATKDMDSHSGATTWSLVPARTMLQHSSHCLVVGKIKARQLVANPGFRNQVVVNGKASLAELTRYVSQLLCTIELRMLTCLPSATKSNAGGRRGSCHRYGLRRILPQTICRTAAEGSVHGKIRKHSPLFV
jgi:hypothetical protein